MSRFIRSVLMLGMAAIATIVLFGTSGLIAQAYAPDRNRLQSYPVGVTFSVNSSADVDSRNSELTLREAIKIARGDLATSSGDCITDAEMARVVFGGSWGGTTDCNYLTSGGGSGSADVIQFDAGTNVVTVTSALPIVDCGDIIRSDAFDTLRRVTIDGTSAGGGTDGLELACPGGGASDIKIGYVTIRNFGGDGITGTCIQTATLVGLVVYGNGGSGITLNYCLTRNPRGNQIGTTNSYDRNYIYSNGLDGIQIHGILAVDTTTALNNHIENNLIGLGTSGNVDLGNGRNGVYLLNAWNNIIGGSAAKRNTISGNNNDGIKIEGDSYASNGVSYNYIGTNMTGTVAIGNGVSGISLIGGTGYNLIGSASGGGNVIAGSQYGIFVNSPDNTIYGNFIGTNASSASGFGNSVAGISLNGGASNNTIGLTSAGWANVISGNTGAPGIDIKDSGTSINTVEGNKIGTNVAGTAALANSIGVEIRNGAANNQIGTPNTKFSNLISGNSADGILIDGASTGNNSVYANYIGTNITGTVAIPNQFGVVIQNGSDNNLIGDIGGGNLISGNTNDGLRIKDSGTGLNNVYSNTIGLNASTNAKLANGWSGIAIFSGASGNHIGTTTGKGNIISGNGGGIYIGDAGTQVNLVISNVIGTNWASASGLGNTSQGVGIYSGAALNFVGFASSPGQGNIISGNGGPGVDIGHSGANRNTVEANFIGTNVAGTAALPNSIGVRIWDGAANNFIGTILTPNARNLISGNTGPGVGVYDSNTISNVIAGNSIGTNRAGTAVVANSNEGVIVQAAASTVISTNLISGNNSNGITIDGARDTRVENNIIGTNGNGTAALANQGSGVSIYNSAIRSVVGTTTTLTGRNLISGNAGDGVYLNTALTTTVESNLIGINLLGTSALPNSGNGIDVQFSNYTYLALYGGYQYISGNAHDGIYVVNSDSTQMGYANRIGFGTNDTSPIGNGWDGVMLNGATNSTVGGLIGNNGMSGVGVLGAASNNRIEPLIDKNNGGLPIDLGDDGPTVNDLNDIDTGPNGLLNYPEVITSSGSTMTGTVCANCTVLIYKAFGNPAANGGGAQFTGQVATANGSGVWTRTLTGGLLPISVTLQTCAGACANYANTSEFSPVSIQYKVYLPLVLKSYDSASAPSSAPNAPAQLIALTASTTAITLTWNDKSTNEDGFKIDMATGVGSTAFSQVGTAGSNVTHTIISSLTPGRSYTFRIRAYNSIGNSGYSNQSGAVTRSTGAVPAAPTNLSATATFTDEIYLHWTDNATTTKTSVIFESSPDGNAFTYYGTITTSVLITQVWDNLLQPGTDHCYRVRMHNANGDSYPSNTACAATPLDVAPAAPISLTLQTISSTAVLLMWVNPTSNDSYKVYESENSGAYTFIGTLTPGNLDGTYIFGNTPGNTYRYKVRAHSNSFGDSPDSSPSNLVTMPSSTPSTASGFKNNAIYPIVSLQIDGVEQFPIEPQGVPSGALYRVALSSGTHNYRVATGFWSDGSRVEMYIYNGTINQSQQITINNPTIAQIMSRFSTSAYYVGEYWSGTNLHSAAFRFFGGGTYNFYIDGVFSSSGGYSLVTYNGDFLVTFQVTGFQGIMDERTGSFNMTNGPSDWRTIQYTYDGY